MKDVQHTISLVACLIGIFTDSLPLMAGAILIMLDMIYSELKKLNDK